MFSQSQIKRTLSQPIAISYITELLESDDYTHRSELADFLGEEWGFQDARGDLQRGGYGAG